ncbi:MAG: DUF3662 and FHA domain-containing protein [Propionibacteriaceae bacterium]|jgi:hypothetical protein|nr:DUF3662 and FHA domain-containing protein [Propionibacteriaceae bacterium]
MGLFGKAEKKLEGAVGGVFARAFKGDVQPVEITNRLCKELDAEAQVLSRDKSLVPNEFLIELSKHDYARLFPFSKTMNAEISAELKDYAAEHAYLFNGPILIAYEERPDLPIGRFEVSSATVAAVDGGSEARVRTGGWVLEVNGVRHPLTAAGLVIGRGSEADLRINDPGISRSHAQITLSPDQGTVMIKDLGSTNGIIVDGQKVAQAELTNGSRIDLGKTQVLVQGPAGR